jgi:hypothetical protein
MLAIDDATLKNTKGTIIVNIKFKNICPKGSNTVAFEPKITPNIPPSNIYKSSTKDIL